MPWQTTGAQLIGSQGPKGDKGDQGPAGPMWVSAFTITYATSITPNCANGYDQRVTLTGNTTVNAATNPTDTQYLLLWFYASGADRTVTMHSSYELTQPVPGRVFTIPSGTWGAVFVRRRGSTWVLMAMMPQAITIDASAITTGTVGYARLPVGSASGSTVADGGHSHPLVLFQGRQTTAQTLAASGTNYPVNLQAEDYDTDNGHSTSTNISRWVCQRAGTYQVDGAVAHGSGTGLRNAQINKNGAVVPGSFNQQAAASTSLNIIDAKQVFVDLVAGDYIELVTVQTQGSNVALTVNSQVYSVLRIRSLALA